MRCKICNSEIEPGSKVCRVCGIRLETSNSFNPATNDSNSSFPRGKNDNAEDLTAFFFNSTPKEDINNKINDNLNNSFKSFFENDFSTESNNNQNIGNNVNNNQIQDNNMVPQKPIFFQSQDDEPQKESFKLPKKFGKIVTLGIIGLVILGISGFFLSKLIFHQSKPYKDNNDNEDDIILNQVDDGNEDDDSQDEDEENNNFQFTMILDNYRFTIPEGYDAEVEEDCLILINATKKVQAVLAIYLDKTLDYYTSQIENVANTWRNKGYQIIDSVQKQYGESNWLIYSGTYNSRLLNISYHRLGEASATEMIIVNDGDVSYDDLYNEFERMITTAVVVEQ